ncbi:MAG: DNA translocase FtsK 4TM domain-containing protein, partial [Geminicoccaceae bacterium]
MAASTADAFGGSPLRARLQGSLRRLGGVAAVVLAVALAVALIGFNWRDPSLNQATAQLVNNPVGPFGAYAADLLYQLFGFAAWVPVMVSLSWGLRLVVGRPLRWPWVPVLSLPLAMLGLAAFLATLPLLPAASWPLRVGLGGAVGDLQWRWFEPLLGQRVFAGASLILAVLLGFTALGIRWAEGLWAAGRVLAGSLWV